VEFFFLIGLVLVAVPFILPIVAWVSARGTRLRLEALEETIAQQRRELDAAVIALRQLRAEGVKSETAPAAAPAPPPRVPPSAPVVRPAPVPPIAPPAPVVPKPAAPAPAPPRTQPAPVTSAPAPARPAPAPQTTTVVPPRPPQPPRTPPAPPPPPPAPAFDWEGLVGDKLFPALAGIVTVIAGVLFLKYSIDHGWLSPSIRAAIGVIVSIALLVACELKAARRYATLANAMDAAAIAILFATFFASHALWNLIPGGVAFVLLGVVTALAVLLSIRRESLFIAVLGLLGGFATPALLSTGENRPIPLFAYLLLLNVGLAWVGYSRSWPILTWLTLALTVVYQWGWVFKFLDASTLPLAMGVFLVFPTAAVAGLILNGRAASAKGSGQAASGAFEQSVLVSSIVPLIFAVYLATVPAFGQHAALMFGFLAIVDAGLLAIAIARWQPVIHGIAAVTTLVVSVVWLAVSYEPQESARVPLIFTPLFVVLYLAAPSIAKRFGADFSSGGIKAHYVAPMLLIGFPVLAAIEPGFAEPSLLVGTLAALVALIAWRAMATREGALYYVASFLAIATQAVWSATHLTLERLGTAVAIYAIFGVMSLGVPVIARRRSQPLLPAWGSGAVQLASLGLLLFLAAGGVAPAALWALALLLAIVNAGLFIESAEGRLPLVSQIGSVLSWLILMVWWREAAGAVGVLPSLTVVVGLALITLAGHAWSVGRSQAAADAGPVRFQHGLYLGLAGHLFLTLLASDRAWSLPPWPVFGALAAITLATSAASLWVRVPSLHVAGTIAAAVAIAVWSWTAGSPEWGMTVIFATAIVSAYALAWIPIGDRLGSRSRIAAGACATLFVVEYALIIAVGGGAHPPFAALLPAHVVTISIVLALTSAFGWRYVAMVAAAPPWFAVMQWQVRADLTETWPQLLALAGALYAVFVAYPFAASARARLERDPYLAAIVASAMAFVAGREAFRAAGLESYVGIVPVLEGAVLALLLRSLLRLQPSGERDMGRLALVAGAALAFATVAIPLQLDHQWITIGWALEGAALAWLYRRVPHRGLLFSAIGLLAVVFVRLAVNPEVLLYEPRGAMRILNWYLYAYSICAAAMLVAGRWLSTTEDRLLANVRASQLLPVGGTVLLFLLLNIEIADYYAVGSTIAFRFGATMAQDLTYTIGWLMFGMGLLAAGIYLHNRPARIAAVTLIAVTTLKCFLYDLSSLEGLPRIASFVGLAISLALVSLALQKFVLSKSVPSEGTAS
jgi:uncharacterized membrane protein